MELCKVILVHQCNRMFKYNIKYFVTGVCSSVVVKALCCKLEGRGFKAR
jgi:hypothetical protein